MNVGAYSFSDRLVLAVSRAREIWRWPGRWSSSSAPRSACRSLLSLFSTHPPLEERVRRLRAMTAY